MIIHVANPIYDSVFKYIMEDERIAKTVLSALLKKQVVKVKVRPHEYSNTTRDKLSMFRIDFAATVRELSDDGSSTEDRIVLIELQKTWLDTEVLRFRQYLGAQYSNKVNIREDSDKGMAYPMVAVYLLGHRVGNITEPVVYVSHDVFDYNGNIVANGSTEPFVESLTHNSIIVQIPLLHGHVNNRLEKVLSVFDQKRIDAADRQVLNIDETQYIDDADMMYMLHRLTEAAADSEMRQDMNVEDEYYQAIEDRDTALMQREKKIEEMNQLISECNAQISEREAQISEREAQISEREAQISERDAQISERDAQLSEREAQLSERDAQLKKSVRIMAQNGMSVDVIASAIGITTDDVYSFLAD